MPPPLTARELRKLLHYHPSTGLFTRLIAVQSHAAGTVAGCTDKSTGYVKVGVLGRQHYAHRLAWLWMTGRWPTEQIDHRDGDRAANQWSNLRRATVAQQRANAAKRTDNTSGFKGVTERRRRGHACGWVAQIHVSGQHIYLGDYTTPAAAHEAYLEAARRHFGDYARAG